MYELQILATKPKNQLFPVISWGIRFLEGSKHSHVSLYIVNEGNVRHAHFNDVVSIPLNEFLQKNEIVDRVSIFLSDSDIAKVDAFTKSKLGVQSGYFSTLFGSMIPMIVRRLTGKKLSNPFVKGITCSELVRESLRQVNEVFVFVLTNDIPKGTFTTIDAMSLAKELSQIQK